MFRKKEITVIEHEVLRLLVRHGTLILSAIKDKAINKDMSTWPLHYSAIVALLNNPQEYTQEKHNAEVGYVDLDFYKKLNPDKPTVKITNPLYDWNNVRDAIEILASNLDVVDTVSSDGSAGDKIRTVIITEKGKLAFKSKYYVKEYKKEIYADLLIAYNRKLFVVTGVIALGTIVTPLVSYFIDNDRNDLKREVKCKEQQIQELRKTLLEYKNSPHIENPAKDSSNHLIF